MEPLSASGSYAGADGLSVWKWSMEGRGLLNSLRLSWGCSRYSQGWLVVVHDRLLRCLSYSVNWSFSIAGNSMLRSKSEFA